MMKSTKLSKKACTLSLSLLLLSNLFLTAHINKTTVSQTILQGDATSLEGFHLHTSTYSQVAQRRWFYEIPLSNIEDTKITSEVWKDTPHKYYYNGYLGFNTYISGYTFTNPEVSPYSDPLSQHLPIDELITTFKQHRLDQPNAKEYSETILLQDYISHYPLYFHGGLYHQTSHFSECEFSEKSLQLLQQEIQIPVYPNEELLLTIQQDTEDQNHYSIRWNNPRYQSQFTTDQMVAFNTETQEFFFGYQISSYNQPTDPSEPAYITPDSPQYLYHATYSINENNEVDIDSLSLIATSENKHSLHSLHISDDHLVAIQIIPPEDSDARENTENYTCSFQVYDAKTFTLLQEIPLSHYTSGIYHSNNGFLLYSNQIYTRNTFSFVLKENDTYTLLYDDIEDTYLSSKEEQEQCYLYYSGDFFSYQDEKLFITQVVSNRVQRTEDFYLRVYEDNDLLFSSRYQVDHVSNPDTSHNYNVQSTSESQIIKS